MTAEDLTPDIIVIGHVNHDRIWHLVEPLRSGARILWKKRETRLGGGGYFTGRRLVELGHRVSIVSTLAQDAIGKQAMDRLAAEGLDTRLMNLQQGDSDITDILLDPNGERTILSSEQKLSRTFHLERPIQADAFYINAPKLPPAIRASLSTARLVVSQLPLREAEPRPADIMVGSKADLPGMSMEDIWTRAREVATDRLSHLVMTDGPAAISVFDGKTEQTVTLARTVSVRDTIGAGDTFSGSLLNALLAGMDVASASQRAGDETTAWLEQRESADADRNGN